MTHREKEIDMIMTALFSGLGRTKQFILTQSRPSI